MNKPLNWFEIPVADLDRASRFYETMFGIQLRKGELGPFHMAVFPYEQDKATGGCLIKGHGFEPSAGGPVLYLNADESFDAVLSRVEPAGGKILMPRSDLPNIGPIAHFADSEGNRVGLHGVK